MRIDAIETRSFRNLAPGRVEFSPGTNILCGMNAQGKTNLIEAVFFLTGARGFRTRERCELIRFGEEELFVSGDVFSHGRPFRIDIRAGARTTITKNGVKMRRAADLGGLFQAVLFCPEDLSIIRAGAAERRRFLDRALSQLRPSYAAALSRYQKLYLSKSRILKDAEEKPSLLSALDDFSFEMLRVGALIVSTRRRFMDLLAPAAREIYADLCGGREEIAFSYLSQGTRGEGDAEQALRAHYERHRAAEIASRSCLTGPHKDDIAVAIGGRDARSFASQGQARSAALSLKLAERRLFYEDTGEYPVLLLDDVLSELDQYRRDFIVSHIGEGQVIITCCEEERLGAVSARLLRVEKGKIQRRAAAQGR